MEVIQREGRLHHMATPHESPLSFLAFGDLWSIVLEEKRWPLFEPYMPPRPGLTERIAEIKVIRNRTAHCRAPHPHDLDRLSLFCRDMSVGIERLLERYMLAASFPDPWQEPLVALLRESWESRSYGTEMEVYGGGWLYAPEPRRRSPVLHAQLLYFPHRASNATSPEGVIYGLRVSRFSQNIDAKHVWKCLRGLRENVTHLILRARDELQFMFAAGPELSQAVTLVHAILQANLDASGDCGVDLSAEWPEQVLPADHPISSYPAIPLFVWDG